MTTFTASEVRELANDFAGYSATHHAIGHGLLDVAYAYADRLEADEAAVPVYQHRYKNGSRIQWFDCDAETYELMECNEQDREHFDRRILYTHPSPPDAERLAEALEIIDGWMELYDHQGTGSSRDASRSEKEWAADRAKLVSLLTAHSTQAHPPVARVPDAETLRLHLGELTPDEVCVAKAAYRLALAAQENPNG